MPGRCAVVRWSTLILREVGLAEYPQEVVQRFHAPPEQSSMALVGEVPGAVGPIVIEDYDPAWADRFAAAGCLLNEALGDLVIAIEHVGSTSVPGLPAKPIIDIDLLIEDTADESRYVPALEARGYRLVLRQPWWYGHRMLVSPAEDMNLHLWPRDAPEPIRHRLFRDWLRSHPEGPGPILRDEARPRARHRASAGRLQPGEERRHRRDPRTHLRGRPRPGRRLTPHKSSPDETRPGGVSSAGLGGRRDHYLNAPEGADGADDADAAAAAAARRAARRGFTRTSSTMAAIDSTRPTPPPTVVTAVGWLVRPRKFDRTSTIRPVIATRNAHRRPLGLDAERADQGRDGDDADDDDGRHRRRALRVVVGRDHERDRRQVEDAEDDEQDRRELVGRVSSDAPSLRKTGDLSVRRRRVPARPPAGGISPPGIRPRTDRRGRRARSRKNHGPFSTVKIGKFKISGSNGPWLRLVRLKAPVPRSRCVTSPGCSERLWPPRREAVAVTAVKLSLAGRPD